MTARASVNRIESAVLAAGGNFRQHGTDRFRATGLCHGGSPRSDSLSFHYDADHRRMDPKCFAGCDWEQILDTLGLADGDRYDEPRRMADTRPRTPRPAPPPRPEPAILPSAPHRWRPGPLRWSKCGHKVAAEYLYFDLEYRLAFGVVRCVRKHFRQWRPHPDASGGREWGLNVCDDRGNVIAVVPKLLYRLPELVKAVAAERVVWICEGEKDVHAVISRPGCVATCGVAGAGGRWQPGYTRFFTGADVCLVADRDETGRHYAESVVEALLPVVRSLEVVQARDGKDAFDHFASGGHTGDFIRVAEPKPFVWEAS